MNFQQSLVSYKRVSITIQGKPVIQDVSFQIYRHEIVGLVGESGSGKSMTALSLLGLLPQYAQIHTTDGIYFYPHQTAIRLDNIEEKRFRTIRGRQIGIIFQEPMTSLNPSKKCGKQIEEVLHIHRNLNAKQRKERVLQLLSDVMLPEPETTYHKYPHQLSGGQRQRVMIAMALACEPHLLIADEPTTALDVIVQKHIIELLASLQQKYPFSILFITHDISLVRLICHRAYVMWKGKIVEELNRVQLLNNQFTHPYTRGLFSCKPTPAMKYQALPTIRDYLENNVAVRANTYHSSELHSSAENKTNLIEVIGLSKYFDLKKYSTPFFKSYYKAVDDVNLIIYKNETLGLVGQSGCGKSTLSRLLLRLMEPTSGRILYEGQSIFDFSKKQLTAFRRKAQIIFQDPYSSLHPSKRILDALLEPLNVHNILENKKSRKDYIVYMLEKTGLDADSIYKYPHQFSGGQRQRICIARALLLQPKFIICDEPVSSLDVSVQAQVLNLLNELKKEFGLTYLFISHNLSVVYHMSDRIAVMHKGQIIECDTAYNILYHPQHSYTRQLIDSSPEVWTISPV